MPNEMPEPMTELGQSAAMFHELYLAYVAAGFTKQEALKIIADCVAALMIEGSRKFGDE